MKFLISQLAFLTSEPEARANLRALAKYFAFLIALVAVYSVLFHIIKLQVENEPHSWITGIYWTLVVMTTLGFGDITFTSDVGRLFSIVVLLSGVVFLLVMLPFLFIRLFYAPWLEARVRLRAPRDLPASTKGHVIIAEYDAIAAGLAERLAAEQIPYVVIEPDPVRAGQLFGDGVAMLTGENDSRLTYERARAAGARLVLANCEDTTNTNITLTVREVAPRVSGVALSGVTIAERGVTNGLSLYDIHGRAQAPSWRSQLPSGRPRTRSLHHFSFHGARAGRLHATSRGASAHGDGRRHLARWFPGRLRTRRSAPATAGR